MFDYIRNATEILSANVNAALYARNDIGTQALNYAANSFPEMVTSAASKATEVGVSCLSTFANEGLDLTSIALVGSALKAGVSIANRSIKETVIYSVAVALLADNNTQLLIGLAGITAGVIYAKKTNQPQQKDEALALRIPNKEKAQ